MSAQATAIALEVKAVAGRVRAAWPVEHFLPLAEEYLRLAKDEAYRTVNDAYLAPQIIAFSKFLAGDQTIDLSRLLGDD